MKTTGTVVVAALTARAVTAPPVLKMISGFSARSSLTSAGSWSTL